MTARGVAVLATAVVAVVAAIVSYDHMRVLAERAGEGWKAMLIPLAVDGMVVSASAVLVVRRRTGIPAGALPWAAWLGGVGASVAANVAAAQPTMVGRCVAVVPPLALAVSFELLRALTAASQPAPLAHPVAPSPAESPGISRPVGEIRPPLGDKAGDTGADIAKRATAGGDLGERNGRRVGRRALAQELGVTEHQARLLLKQGTGHTGRSTNGHRVRQPAE